MRVLVVTTWFPSAESPSTAPFNLKHVQALALCHEVHVVHVRLGGSGAISKGEYGGVRVTRIPFSPLRPWGYLAVLRQVRAALRGADVLHTMAFTSAAVVAPLRTLIRKPWIHTEHWSGMARPSSVSKLWVIFSWLRYILKLPDAVTAVSVAQAEQLARFTRQETIDVIPNVVVVESEFADRTWSTTGVLRVLSIGGLIAGKRPVMAVETLAALRNHGFEASLTWVGDGPLRGEVEAAADKAGVTDYLMLMGWVEPRQVQQALRQADVFLLPTNHETFCVAAAEAVAAGLPAVVTALPAVKDFLSEENSVLVSCESAQAYSAAVVQALEKFAGVSGEVIAGTIPKAFTPQAIVEEFTRIYARAGGPSAQREENQV